MIGDILFYRMDHWNFLDEVVLLYEGKQNDFVHVAIQVSETRKVEAIWNGGVVLSNLNNDRSYVTYSPKVKSVKKGIDWLQSQVGQDYGYGDIADIVMNNTPIFECHYDCSALAMEYLKKLKASYENVDSHLITPQKLADMLGIKE